MATTFYERRRPRHRAWSKDHAPAIREAFTDVARVQKLRTRPPVDEEGEEVGDADVAVAVEIRRTAGVGAALHEQRARRMTGRRLGTRCRNRNGAALVDCSGQYVSGVITPCGSGGSVGLSRYRHRRRHPQSRFRK